MAPFFYLAIPDRTSKVAETVGLVYKKVGLL